MGCGLARVNAPSLQLCIIRQPVKRDRRRFHWFVFPSTLGDLPQQAPLISQWNSFNSNSTSPTLMPRSNRSIPNRALSPVLPLPRTRSCHSFSSKDQSRRLASGSASTFALSPILAFGPPLPSGKKSLPFLPLNDVYILIATLLLSPADRNWAFTNTRLERIAGRSLYPQFA
jgi:hypothetical protein